jgi:hypothetical protein
MVGGAEDTAGGALVTGCPRGLASSPEKPAHAVGHKHTPQASVEGTGRVWGWVVVVWEQTGKARSDMLGRKQAGSHGRGGEEGSQDWALDPTLPLTHCMTRGRSCPLSGPQSPHLWRD